MRLVSFLKIGSLAAVSLLLLWSCVKDKKKEDEAEPDPSGFDRTAMLTHYADHIIIPGYDTFKVALDSMKNKCTAFTSSPTLTTLSDFRNAWEGAYIQWQRVELFDVGPANDNALRNYLNIYPVSTADITANMNNTSSSLEVPAAYDAQGFPAFDYLLNGVGTTEQEILDMYTTASDAAVRLAYVTRLMNQMNDKFTLIYNSWKSTYRAQFINSSSMGLNGSTSLMVNAYVLNFERYIRSGKFGIPAGAMTGGTPSPALVEAYHTKDISLTLAKTALQASVDFFNGKSRLTGVEGPSLKTYIDAVEGKDSQSGLNLTDVINTKFTEIATAMNALSENLSEEVVNNNAQMVVVFQKMQDQVRLLKVDMTSALSITITYTDNDGD